MKRLLTLFFAITVLTACADHADDTLGSEALVYQQVDTFTISLKHDATKHDQQQLLDYLTAFEADGANGKVDVRYSTQQGKLWALKVKQRLLNNGLKPSDIAVQRQSIEQSTATIAFDYAVTISAYKVKTETCPILTSGVKQLRKGCFVDSLRLKQISHPEQLTR